jgi:hypothetical protein
MLAVLGLALLAGCGPKDEGVVCGGINQPTTITLSNLTPALGDSVPNDAIVHSFSVVDDFQFGDVVLDYPDAHTAGTANPALVFGYNVAEYTTDYTAAAVTWENAPAHVEIDNLLVYQTPDGCAYRLPSPLFSYDVTQP